MREMTREIREHLNKAILPFWKGLPDCGERLAALVLALTDATKSIRMYDAQENGFEPVLMGQNGLPVFPFDVTNPKE